MLDKFVSADGVALLGLIYHSEYVSRNQLRRLLLTDKKPVPTRTLNWRLQQLVAHKLINCHSLPLKKDSQVFSIRKEGLDFLLTSSAFVITSKPDRIRPSQDSQMLRRSGQALTVNEVRIAAQAMTDFLEWKSGPELEAMNMLADRNKLKDFDGILAFRLNGTTSIYNLGIKVELIAKTRAQYQKIALTLSREKKVMAILYLVQNLPMQDLLLQAFRSTTVRIMVSKLASFLQQGLHATGILAGQRERRGPIAELLNPKPLDTAPVLPTNQ